MTALQNLTQTELLALALEATRRGDSGHSLSYLREACDRGDASPQACFLLGSEYAQIGLIDNALQHIGRAVALAPDYAIARFQLGMLHLTSAQPNEALAAWAPLAELGSEHPLALFRQGLEHLIRDEFDDCIQWLERGIERNDVNPALSADMRKIIDRVKAVQAQNIAGAAAQPADEAKKEEPQSHLFLSAYAGGDKVH